MGMILKKIKIQNRELRLFHLLTSASRVHFLDGKSATNLEYLKSLLIDVHLLHQMQKHL